MKMFDNMTKSFFLFLVFYTLLIWASINMYGHVVRDIAELEMNPLVWNLRKFLPLFCLLLWSTMIVNYKSLRYVSSLHFTLFFILLFTYIVSLWWGVDNLFLYLTILLPISVFIYVTKYFSIYGFPTNLKIFINIAFWGSVIIYFQTLFFKSNISLGVLFSSNESYFVLFQLPFFLLLNTSKKIKIIAIVITFLVLLSSSKRTGLVSFAIGILLYEFIDSVIINKERKFKFSKYILIVSGMSLLGYFLIESQFSRVLERFTELSDDGGSGRDYIFEEVFLLIQGSDTIHYLFGHGWGQVAKATTNGFSAHNDFLEIWYDFGFVGFSLYLVLYYQLIVFVKRLCQKQSKLAAPMALSVVFFLINSTASHIFIDESFFIIFIFFWGYIIICSKKHLHIL